MKKKYLVALCLCSTLILGACGNSAKTQNDVAKTETKHENKAKSDNNVKADTTSKIDNAQLKEVENQYTENAKAVYGKDVAVKLKSNDTVQLDGKTYVFFTFENKNSDDTYNRLAIAKLDNGKLSLMQIKVEDTPVLEGLPALSFNGVVDNDKFKITHYVPAPNMESFSTANTREYVMEFDDDNGVAKLDYDDIPKPEHNKVEIQKIIGKQPIVAEKLGDLETIFNADSTKKLDKNDMYSPFVWNKFDILNEINTYTNDDMDLDDTIDKLKNLFVKTNPHETLGQYIEKDLSYKDLTPDMIKELKGDEKSFNSVRLTKDNTFLVYLVPGYGGVFPAPEDESNWKIDGDTVYVKFYYSGEGNPYAYTVKYKLNDKKYLFDKIRSIYYIDDVEK